MNDFDILAALATLAAVFAWLNDRFLRLPPAVGLTLISLVFSLGVVALGWGGFDFESQVLRVVEGSDLGRTLLQGMLGALLFAGALHVKLEALERQKRVVAALAIVGVLLSTALVGAVSWWILNRLLEVPLSLLACFLFGALVSPTDPIAVLAILKRAGIPKSLETKIAGESLFNDGAAVVLFLFLVGAATGGEEITAASVLHVLTQEVIGGLLYGALLGLLAYRMLKAVDNYQVEVLITVAIVTGGYDLALRLGLSGPLAMVVAGLLLGNHGRAFAMSDTTRERLDVFWELVDEVLNALLFVMIGVEVLALRFTTASLFFGLLAIPAVLAGRWLSVASAISVLRHVRDFSAHAVKILTWAGLKGGISVALALSLPAGAAKDILLPATYLVVAFSILVQGLTLGPISRRLYARGLATSDG